MLDLFQIMAAADCNGIGPIVSFIKYGIMPIIQIGIPIVLIVYGSLDLGKAVMGNDDKEIKGATSKLIKRVVAAVVIFFIPFIVNLAIGLISKAGDDVTNGQNFNWAKCWENPQ